MEYSVWVLVLQTAAYASYLDFGLQSAVGRHVAFAGASRDAHLRDSIYNTARSALLIACAACIVLLVAAVALLPSAFPSIPVTMVASTRWTLLIVGISTALGLPASACNGVFIGMQRNEVPAITVGIGRLLSAIGLAFAAARGASIVVMACVLASCNILSYAAQYGALKYLFPEVKTDFSLASRATGRQLLDYCVGLSIMSLAMLLVRGFDLVLVGRFEFGALPAFSAAASVITFLGGLLFAVITVMMPHAAVLHARKEANQLGRLVVESTSLSVLLLTFVSCALILFSKQILSLWIGTQASASESLVLVILVVANVIRLIGAPYSIILVGAGKARLISVSPLAEGISNFLASIFLGSYFGSLGVAMGTLLGSIVSLVAHCAYSMPRTFPDIRFSRREYLRSGILNPVVATSPLILAAGLTVAGAAVPYWCMLSCFALSGVGALLLVGRAGRVPPSCVSSDLA
jgi:O-antigen/teichoic acid export membrane protein